MAFPIKCGDCKKSFSISDDVFDRKVRGKVVTIKCKSCGSAIRVDGTKEGARSIPPKASAAAKAPPEAKPEAPAREKEAPRKTEGEAGKAGVTATPVKQKSEASAPKATPSPVAKKSSPIAATPKPAKTTPKPAEASEKKTAPSKTTGSFRKAGEATPKPAGAKPMTGKSAALRSKTPPKGVLNPLAKGPAGAIKPAKREDSGVLWAVDYGEQQHRELTTDEIAEELRVGAIDGQTLVWHDNMPDWLAIRDVKELRSLIDDEDKTVARMPISQSPPPLPKPTGGPASRPPPAAPSPPKKSSPPAPPPRPPDAAPPSETDEVVTSARLPDSRPNAAAQEDPFADLKGPDLGAPVGGGLNDALTAATAPAAGGIADLGAAAPVGGLPGVAPAAPPTAPAAVQAFPGVVPAPAATPAAPAVPAAPAAPTAPAAPAFTAPGAGIALSDDLDWPQAKSKKPVVFAVLGALVLVVAIWAIASSSGGEEAAPTVTPQAATPAAPNPMDSPASRNPMDSPGSPAPAPTSQPAAGDAPPGENAPSTAPASGDFEDIFKKNVKKEH